MTQLLLPRWKTGALPQDPDAAREILLMHASALIGRQVREQFWIVTGGIGILVLAISEFAHLGIELGYLGARTFFTPDLIGISQALSLIVFLLTVAIFLAGRLRLVRSEIDLLRLRIEMLSADLAGEEMPAKASAPVRKTSSGRVRPPRRRINLSSSD